MKKFFCPISLFGIVLAVSLNLNGADSYSFGLISDTHFGGKQFYDKYQPGQANQAYDHWLSHQTGNLALADKFLAEAPKASFLIHAGDLVDGRCGNLERQTKQLAEGWKRTRGAFSASLPFIPVNGNHETYDFEAPGTYAYPAYEATVQKYAAREFAAAPDLQLVAGRLENGSIGRNFAFRRGPDLFIGYNSNIDTYDFVKKVLTDNPKTRYVFAIGHIPVINHAHGGIEIDSPECGNFMENHNRFLRLFQSRNAILLCGDTHRLGMIDYVTGEGRITELIGAGFVDGTYHDVTGDLSGMPIGWPSVGRQCGLKRSPRQQFLSGGMVRFWSGFGSGIWKIHVSDNEVIAEFAAWSKPGVAKRLMLRGPSVNCEPIRLDVPRNLAPGKHKLPLHLATDALKTLQDAEWKLRLPEGWTAENPCLAANGSYLEVTVPDTDAFNCRDCAISLSAKADGRIVAHEDRHFRWWKEFSMPATEEGLLIDLAAFNGKLASLDNLGKVSPSRTNTDGLDKVGRSLELFFDLRDDKAILRNGNHCQLVVYGCDNGDCRAWLIRDGGRSNTWHTLKTAEGKLLIPWRMIAPSEDLAFTAKPGSRIGMDAFFDGKPLMGNNLPTFRTYNDPSVWATVRIGAAK